MIGETLGSYRVIAKVGEGGMGAVYLAEHPLLGRKAAIKMLRPEYSNDQDAVARFFREARSTANLRHPALVDVFDYGVHASGNAYITMDYLEGESLEQRVSRTAVPLGESLEIGRQIAAGLAVAHAAGIVHRDLKPGNIFLISDPVRRHGEIVKILDFGIAKLINHPARPGESTGTNVVMGTPLYMAPEQCAGAAGVDHRADIYALGCVLYRMTCGRLPFEYEWPGEVIAAHLREPPAPPRTHDPSIPALVESIIMKALAKNPAQRYQTLEEMARDLEFALAGDPSVKAVLGVSPSGAPGPGHSPSTPGPAPWTPQGQVLPTPGSGTLMAPPDPFGAGSSPDLADAGEGAKGATARRSSRNAAARRPAGTSAKVWVAVVALAALASVAAWVVFGQRQSEPTAEADSRANAALFAESPPSVAPDPTAATTATAATTVEARRAAPTNAPSRDELQDPAEAVPHPSLTDDAVPSARGAGASGTSQANPMPTTVRIGITNARRGLTVKADGRAVPLPLQLPRDMQMHELLFETPNFRPERRRVRADRDQSIVLDNKPGFFVP